MSVFYSPRERRLWLWTAFVLLTIYATLGLVHSLAGFLRAEGLLAGFFIAGLVLVVAAIAVHGLRTRPGRLEIAVFLGVAAVYVLVFVRMSLPEERTHLVEYGVVGLLVHAALTERKSRGARVYAPAWLAIALTSVLGAVDESIQSLLPSRVFDPRDIGFNALAGVMAVAGSTALRWARERVAGLSRDASVRDD